MLAISAPCARLARRASWRRRSYTTVCVEQQGETKAALVREKYLAKRQAVLQKTAVAVVEEIKDDDRFEAAMRG